MRAGCCTTGRRPTSSRSTTSDTDVGSTSPALLPRYHGLPARDPERQGGLLHLLNLARLNGTRGPAGEPARRGAASQLRAPGGGQVLTAPAVWSDGGRVLVFVGDDSGTGAYALAGGRIRGCGRYGRTGRRRPARWSPAGCCTSTTRSTGSCWSAVRSRRDAALAAGRRRAIGTARSSSADGSSCRPGATTAARVRARSRSTTCPGAEHGRRRTAGPVADRGGCKFRCGVPFCQVLARGPLARFAAGRAAPCRRRWIGARGLPSRRSSACP